MRLHMNHRKSPPSMVPPYFGPKLGGDAITLIPQYPRCTPYYVSDLRIISSSRLVGLGPVLIRCLCTEEFSGKDDRLLWRQAGLMASNEP
jgi:hypothetical protein